MHQRVHRSFKWTSNPPEGGRPKEDAASISTELVALSSALTTVRHEMVHLKNAVFVYIG